MEKDDKKLNSVAKELYDLISTQFGDLKLGDDSATVVTEPEYARFFDFTYGVDGSKLGKVSISLDERAISVIYKKNFVSNQSSTVKKSWYDFLRKIRKIANINRLTFDVRDIDKSNLTKRDYQVMSNEKFKGNAMTESKFYGTSMRSYLNIGEARLVIHHSQPVAQDVPGGRSQHIESIYVESGQGERFKYPIKHLNGAKAMARHVSEGGNPYDDFGSHIVGLSEELGKLGKFKRYMGRGGVMAESLAQYVDAVNERIGEVRKRIEKLQRESFYREAFESFETTVLEEVPSDVAENWIEELTIRQFNEELKDVFPYIYRIVSEHSKPKMLGPDDLAGMTEDDDPCWKGYKQIGMKKKGGKEVPNCVPEEIEIEQTFEELMGQFGEAALNEAGLPGAYVRFVEREGASIGGRKKNAFLYMIVGFGNNPSDVKYTTAEAKRTVNSLEDIERFAQKLLSKDSMMNIESLIFVDESNDKGMWGITAKYSFVRDFFEKAEAENNPKIQVQAKDRRDPKVDDKVKVISNKKDSKGTWANPDIKVEPPEQSRVFYVSLENPKMMDYLHRTKQEFMQKYWRPNIKRFVLNKKQLDNLKNFVNSPKNIEKFGNSKVWEFDPRNFKEEFNTPVDEGIRDKLKVLALIGMAGMGGNMALDAISAKNSPLGQALAVAAQQGDQEAAMHLKNLDAYIDGRDTRTLSGLRQQYLGKSAFEDQETDECGCDDGGMPKSEKPKSPLGDFILSFYDRTSGQFPKGETAVLTMVEKEYGDHYVPMATEFINRVHSTFKEFAISENPEIARIRSLAGL